MSKPHHDSGSQQPGSLSPGAFSLSCWVLGGIAFLQIMGVALGLAVRPSQILTPTLPDEPRVVYVPVPTTAEPVAASVPSTAPPTAPEPDRRAAEEAEFKQELARERREEKLRREAARLQAAADRTPSQTLKRFPQVPDPVAERLVDEAREASLRSDHLSAVIKLEAALKLEPDHPTVSYYMGRNFEAMGLWDRAMDRYLKVHQAGPMKAGVLWRKVARKLEHGIVPEVEGLANLGPVRKNAPQVSGELGTKHSVILPVAVAPSADFDADLLRPVVHFFEKQKGELKQVTLPENAGFQWLDEPVDWTDGEELVEVWYHIPPTDAQQQHLFGNREFHGFVAELYYDNQLLDIRAQPRPLVAELRKEPARNENDFWSDDWEDVENYQPGDPLLPTLSVDDVR